MNLVIMMLISIVFRFILKLNRKNILIALYLTGGVQFMLIVLGVLCKHRIFLVLLSSSLCLGSPPFLKPDCVVCSRSTCTSNVLPGGEGDHRE